MLYIDIDKYCAYYNAPRKQWRKVLGPAERMLMASLKMEMGHAPVPDDCEYRWSDYVWATHPKDIARVMPMLHYIDHKSEEAFNEEV
jgi:hypothetical protein